MVQQLFVRTIQKHDLEVNWLTAADFIPLHGEIIIYDKEVDQDGNLLQLPPNRTTPYTYARMKIGDGFTTVNALPFIDENTIVTSAAVTHAGHTLTELLNSYLLDLDYSAIAFDTSEIVVDTSSETEAILGKAVLGKMILI
jgi:hypothetical protein